MNALNELRFCIAMKALCFLGSFAFAVYAIAIIFYIPPYVGKIIVGIAGIVAGCYIMNEWNELDNWEGKNE